MYISYIHDSGSSGVLLGCGLLFFGGNSSCQAFLEHNLGEDLSLEFGTQGLFIFSLLGGWV